MLWSLDDTLDGTDLVIGFPYFEVPDPIVWTSEITYTDGDEKVASPLTHEWNHGLGEILTSLLDAGMELTGLVEHTSVPYEALPGQMEDVGGGEWRLRDRPERLPHTYTLQAVKRR